MLLTQIARCEQCGGGLSLRTGKSGQYRYYACSQAATKGGQACPGRSIRMETLDEIVLEALETRLLVPARLKALLEHPARRILESQSDSQGRDKALARELRQLEQAIERLFRAVEDGLVQDGDLLRRRLAGHTQRRDELLHLKAVNRRRRDIPPGLLSRRNLEAFGRALRSRLREPNSPLARAYVRSLVERVTVGETRIEIRGQKAGLLEALGDPDAFFCTGVPSFVQDWRRGQSSANPSLVRIPC